MIMTFDEIELSIRHADSLVKKLTHKSIESQSVCWMRLIFFSCNIF